MNNNLFQITVKQRLNKLASFDYDNLECWQIAEAGNKAQLEIARKQIYGMNSRREGAEQSSGLVDDLQRLLIQETITMDKKKGYYEGDIPEEYLHYVRTDVFAKSDCCPERRIIVYEVEEANISIILDNNDKKPSFEWAETVATRINNKLRVYTNDEFEITKCDLVYFRKPREIQFKDCIDIATGLPFSTDQTCEFNEDMAGVVVDATVAILAGDIESMMQFQRAKASVEETK